MYTDMLCINIVPYLFRNRHSKNQEIIPCRKIGVKVIGINMFNMNILKIMMLLILEYFTCVFQESSFNVLNGWDGFYMPKLTIRAISSNFWRDGTILIIEKFGPGRFCGMTGFLVFLHQLFSYLQPLRGASNPDIIYPNLTYQKLVRKYEETRHGTKPTRSKRLKYIQ